MSQPVSVLAPGVQSGDALRATAKVSANTRVLAAAGPVGVITDVMQFPGPGSVVGNWIVGATRVLVNGIPAVSGAATGTSFGPPPPMPPTGTMTVVQGDPRVKVL
jgi:hypothetical protein